MTSTMRFDKWENSLGQPYGTVVQVVQAIKKDTWSVSGNATTFYEVGGYSLTLTPKFANSKILVRGMVHASSWYWEIQGRIYRNGVAIDDALGDARGSRARATFTQTLYHGAGSARDSWASIPFEYLDSPNTTSPVTYSLGLNGYSTGLVGVNRNVYADTDNTDYYANPISTLIAMEITQ
jgi:hypothetical protein